MVKIYIYILLFVFLTGNNLFSQEIEHEHSIHNAFIENKGQWNDDILFKSKFNGGNLWIQQNKFLFHLQDFSATHEAHANLSGEKFTKENRQTVVHLNFIGSNKVTEIQKSIPTSSYYNYFLGNDSSKWAYDVRGFSEATLIDFYNGIDLKLIENLEDLKYEFHVKPNFDPNKILLEYVGQKYIQIGSEGNLIVSTELGNIIENKPYSYQIINGKVIEVKCEFILLNNNVSFKLGRYNPEIELIIDPKVIFATYSGSTTDNFGMTATYAHNGDAYSGGTIFGNTYPTPDIGAYDVNSNFSVQQGDYGITDVFISKYSSDGTQMLWTSFIGGGNDQQGTETVHSLIADKNDNLYFFGATSSVDFPIVNGFQISHGGGVPGLNFMSNGVYHLNQGTDIFVSKLSSNGHNLLGSTYVGGAGNDGVNYTSNLGYHHLMTNYGDNYRGEIMLDKNDECIVTSCSRSTNFPILKSFQAINNGGQDGVIFKLSSNLSSLLWSSYFGGSKDDACNSVKIDSNDFIVFAGGTTSIDLPKTIGGWNPNYKGGVTDGFVCKLVPSGDTIKQTSYVGSTSYDQVFFIEIDRNNNVFLLGQTRGGTFPVVNSTFVNLKSSQFICKLNSALTTVLNSTVFGNGDTTINISPAAFLVDVCGNMYVSGWGASVFSSSPLTGMPVTSPPSNLLNGYDFYLLVLSRSFDTLIFANYLGGAFAREHVDGGTSRFDKYGIIYQSVCGGCGGFSDFPTFPNPGVWSNNNLSSNCNNVVFKFDFEIRPKSRFTTASLVVCKNHPLAIQMTDSIKNSDTFLWDFGNGNTNITDKKPYAIYLDTGVFRIKLFVTDSVCLLVDSMFIDIKVIDDIKLQLIPSQFEICKPIQSILVANSFGTADYFIWSTNKNFTDTLNISVSDSTYSTLISHSGYLYVKAGNSSCFKTDSLLINVISSNISLSGDTKICKKDISEISIENSTPSISFNYVWLPSNIISSNITNNKIKVSPDSTQYLYLLADNNLGCSFKDSILIQVSDIDSTFYTIISSEIFVPRAETISLSVTPSSNGFTYAWTPSSVVQNPTYQQTTAKLNETTLFKLSVTDGICTKYDSVLVKVFPYVCDDPSVFIPNAFSPNGDGNNDVLVVRGKMIKEMTFRVFDRWGELIFETHERGIGWDGTYKGKKLDPDVYDYYLKVTCIDDIESIVKGNVTLLK